MLTKYIRVLANRPGTEVVVATADGAIFSGKIESLNDDGILSLDGSGSSVISSPGDLAGSIENIAKSAGQIPASKVRIAVEHVCWMMSKG